MTNIHLLPSADQAEILSVLDTMDDEQRAFVANLIDGAIEEWLNGASIDRRDDKIFYAIAYHG